MQRSTGTVRWFNDAKGYGFITSDAPHDKGGRGGQSKGKDCFVHFSAIKTEGFKTLAEGDRVEFDLVQEEKGPSAKNVVKL